MWRSLRFWLHFGALMPVAVPQALHTRRTALRLPEAEGPQQGTFAGEGEPWRLVVIGESTVAGVGVKQQADGLAAAVARAFAARTGRPVHWRAHGRNGARIRDVRRDLLPDDLHHADLVLVSIGVNDTTGFSSPRQWREQLRHLVADIRRQTQAPITFLALPPMHHFTALPQPLRGVIGHRAVLMDHHLRRALAGLPGCRVLDYGLEMHPRYLAADGYHPSAEGYAVMGETVARLLAASRD
ncbi:MAG TPA: SGNH/GDSL hydrolase family protein [Fluviicoccus sp.]|nr:SGNH/GDSL hydrolase family protein [Fluviicoccus sp.]